MLNFCFIIIINENTHKHKYVNTEEIIALTEIKNIEIFFSLLLKVKIDETTIK